MGGDKIRGLGESSEGNSKKQLKKSRTWDFSERGGDQEQRNVGRHSKSLPHQHASDGIKEEFKQADEAKIFRGGASWGELDQDSDATLLMHRRRTGIKKGEISEESPESSDKSVSHLAREWSMQTDKTESSLRGASRDEELAECPYFPQLSVRRREVDVARGIAASAWEQLRKRFGWIGEHRPERVNKVINDINDDLGKIHEIVNAACLSGKPKVSQYVREIYLKVGTPDPSKYLSLVNQVEQSYKESLQDYGNGSGNKAIRDKGEQRLKELQHEMAKVREDLEKLHQVYKNVEAIETYVPQAFRPFVRQSTQEVSDRVQQAFREGINNYRPGEGWSLPQKELFEDDGKWLEARVGELKEVDTKSIASTWKSFKDFTTAYYTCIKDRQERGIDSMEKFSKEVSIVPVYRSNGTTAVDVFK